MRIKELEEIDRLINSHFQNLKDTYSTLDYVAYGKTKVSRKDILESFEKTEQQIKYNCFLTSSFLDLLTTLKGFLNSTTEWEDIYFAKSGYLTIYETINTYYFHHKKIFNRVNDEFSVLKERFIWLNKELKTYKEKYDYDELIKKVRHKTAGHFDKDFIEFYNYINKIDKNTSINAIEDFLDFLKRLMIFDYEIADIAEKESQEWLSKINKK